MTAPELKPCPFCGGEAEIWRAHECRTAWIACMGKCVVLISKEYLSDDEAITAWNRRADLAAVQPAQVHNKIEAAAFSMWKAEADRAAPNVGKNRTPERFADASMAERDRWLSLAHAAMTATDPQPDPRDEVIKGLVEALMWLDANATLKPQARKCVLSALAAAKAVQHD